MFVLQRSAAQLFRATLRRCVDGPATRADTIPVLIRHTPSGVLMHAHASECDLLYFPPCPPPSAKGALAFPASALALFDGRTSDGVELVLPEPGKAEARWTERGEARIVPLPTLDPESVPDPPALPRSFAALPHEFLSAFHDAALTAPKEAIRYALNRVMLRAKAGEVVGTDAKQLVVHGGFRFPFEQDVLVPRIGGFGPGALGKVGPPEIGRTDSHLVIRVERWTIALEIDQKGRYPDTATLIPRSGTGATKLHLDPQDVALFLRALTARLRRSAAHDLQLTIDLHPTPCVRFQINEEVVESPLAHSQVDGAPLRVVLNMQHLLRALELRFTAFEIRSADKPFVARDGQRVFLMMPLPVSGALTAAREQRPTPAEPVPSEAVVPVESVKTPVVILPPREALEPARGTLDVLAEAEGFRQAVWRAADHAGRLLRFLREVCSQPHFGRVVKDSLLALTHRPPESRGEP